MLSFLQKLLNRYSGKQNLDLLPEKFSDTEKIARSIFSPINVTRKNKLKTNAFRSPAGRDEVSVNRLDFTNANFCKKLSKSIERPENKRSYFGFAILTVKEILDCESDIVYSPILEPNRIENLFHSDIKVGFIPEKGVPLPAKISYKISQLTNSCRFYIDPNPYSSKWEGEILE